MLLVIDCGNTNIVFGIFSQKNNSIKLINSWRIETNIKKTEDSYYVWLENILKTSSIDIREITGISVASVVPEVLIYIKKMIIKYFKVPFVIVGEKNTKLPICINIDSPNDAGSDRLVNACAIKFLKYDPAIIVDFGTATTFDIIGIDGSYEGGIISPGVNLSIESLYRSASRLPKINIRALDDPKLTLIGKNTVSAMESGLYWGYVSMVEGLIARMHKQFRDYKVVVTGGLSKVFKDNLTIIDVIDENLTLKGLAFIYLNHFNNIDLENNV